MGNKSGLAEGQPRGQGSKNVPGQGELSVRAMEIKLKLSGNRRNSNSPEVKDYVSGQSYD